MEYVRTCDIEKEFYGINGGIDVWLGHLANDLAAHGTLGYLQDIEAKIAGTQDPDKKADLYQVSRGFKKLEMTALEKAVAAIEEPFQRMHALLYQFHRCRENLEASKCQWNAAAQTAKLQLAAWGKWADATEIARNNELFPFFFNSSGISRESLKFTCSSSVFDSPMSLEADFSYFEGVVDAIRASIVRGYSATNHPEGLDRLAFDKAVDALGMVLKQHKALLLEEDKVRQKLIPAEERNASAKQSLVNLLELMSDTAQWALFRLNRPDLRGRAAA